MATNGYEPSDEELDLLELRGRAWGQEEVQEAIRIVFEEQHEPLTKAQADELIERSRVSSWAAESPAMLAEVERYIRGFQEGQDAPYWYDERDPTTLALNTPEVEEALRLAMKDDLTEARAEELIRQGQASSWVANSPDAQAEVERIIREMLPRSAGPTSR